VHELNITHGKELKYRGGGGNTWGDVDIAVEVVGRGKHKIAWRWGF